MRIPPALDNQDGVGLVGAMLAVSLLAVFALVAAHLAVNERRTAFNDAVHERSFLAADSGSEAAIAWLFVQDGPIPFDVASGTVATTSMDGMLMGNDQGFAFDILAEADSTAASGWRPASERPGYSLDLNFVDYFYEVGAVGEAGLEGRSAVELNVSKLTKIGHQ